MAFWQSRKVLVTGGASFIRLPSGGPIVGCRSRRAGGRRSLQWPAGQSPVAAGGRRRRVPWKAIFATQAFARGALTDRQMVFHLAADHGGRGYVDLHQAGPASNLLLDGLIFHEALRAGIEKVVFASSGCVYPNGLQADPRSSPLLAGGSGSPALRRRQSIWLGQADGGADLAVLPPRAWAGVGQLPLLHGLRSPRAREPRGDRDDRAGVCAPGSLRGLGRRHPGAQLDVCRRHRPRPRCSPPSTSKTARRSTSGRWSGSG